jgi:hypothetical protein
MNDPNNPIETLVVTLFEHPCLTARLADGMIALSIRDLCDAVGLRLYSQLRRLRADPDLREGIVRLRVSTAGGIQDQDFLILEFVAAWVSTVDRSRASTVVQERLRYLRIFSIRHVNDAIAQAAGLPEGPSRNIEDLRDLARYDEAIRGIAERQQALEESQAKARQAWRAHEQRISALEAQHAETSVLSRRQRGTIYQMVQLWAQARVERERMTSAAAFAGCWSAIKARYKVAKYEDIRAAQYDDCITYIQRAYQQLTGAPLPISEQAELPLEEGTDG